MSQLEPLSEHGNGISNGVGHAIRTVPNKEEDLQVLKSSVVNSVNHMIPFESQEQSWTNVSAVWLVLGNWRAHGLCALPRGQPSDLMESFVRVRSLVQFLSDPGPIIVYPSQWLTDSLTHWLTESRPCWRFNELTLADGIKYLSNVDIEMKLRFSCQQLATTRKAGNSCHSCWQLNLNFISLSTLLRYLIPSARVNSLNLQQGRDWVSQSVTDKGRLWLDLGPIKRLAKNTWPNLNHNMGLKKNWAYLLCV